MIVHSIIKVGTINNSEENPHNTYKFLHIAQYIRVCFNGYNHIHGTAFKAGVNVKAVLRLLNTTFLPIS